ncbi:hypothetical protein K491DRAFT_711875 [Lophiostoma macrostomum CBS 122681]|uniref:Uncharacterized protein n=1 Tax=Lophiostoma macrostomum CBS 122681 TaxID=1314788 RepID=A0A6A6TN50_9PLEO|nr:hypothetical protein K491DRAFT_711875 [Lophiostoma macrostomum CBS 122681]
MSSDSYEQNTTLSTLAEDDAAIEELLDGNKVGEDDQDNEPMPQPSGSPHNEYVVRKTGTQVPKGFSVYSLKSALNARDFPILTRVFEVHVSQNPTIKIRADANSYVILRDDLNSLIMTKISLAQRILSSHLNNKYRFACLTLPHKKNSTSLGT